MEEEDKKLISEFSFVMENRMILNIDIKFEVEYLLGIRYRRAI